MTEKPLKQNPVQFVWGLIKGILRLFCFFVITTAAAMPQAFILYSRIGNILLIPQLAHKLLVLLLGFRVRVHGKMLHKHPTLFIANHSSYLDIPVLGSIIPASFVAKSEVASWPIFGFLAKLQATTFVERRATRALEQRNGLQARLFNGESLIIFAEGTSSNGHKTLPFKTSLFGIAQNKLPNGHCPTVQPVSIICSEYKGKLIKNRHIRDCYAWYDEGDYVSPALVPHLWKMFTMGGFTVDVIFHHSINPADFADRKALADYCHKLVSEGVHQCVSGHFSTKK